MKEIVKEIVKNTTYGRYHKLRKLGLWGYVVDITSFLDISYINIKPSQRFWHIKNDIFTIVMCRICDVSQAKYHVSHGYNTCSNKCKQEQTKRTNNKKYGADSYVVSNEGKKKSKDTCIKKYGVENYSKSDVFIDKIKSTNIKKYGVEWFCGSPEQMKKSKDTCIKKYGVDNYLQTDEFKKKSKDTCIKKYGVDNYTKSVDFINIMKKINVGKYGVDNYFKTSEFKLGFKKYMESKYGVDNYFKTDILKEHNMLKYERYMKDTMGENYKLLNYGMDLTIKHNSCGSIFTIKKSVYFSRRNKGVEVCLTCHPFGCNFSKGEKEVLDFIKSIYGDKIIENNRNIIYPYELDIWLPAKRIAIEFNGTYIHADPRFYESHKMIYGKSVDSIWLKDRNKLSRCKKKNISLITIWEHDWNNNRVQIEKKLCDSIIQ